MTATLSPLRKGRLTGSRIGGVLGRPGERRAVMRELVREHFGDEPEFTGSPATDWGHEHEPVAIEEFEWTKGVPVHGRQEFFIHPEVDWLGVTVDGLVGEDELIEVKCPYTATYSSIEHRPGYYEQVQLQLACTGRRRGWFFIWRPGGALPPEPVERDERWLDSRYEALVAFRSEFLATIADPERAAPYRAPRMGLRSDPEWLLAEEEMAELLDVKDWLDGRIEQVRRRFVELSPDGSAKGERFALVRSERQGSVAYARAIKENLPGLDLSKYRGEPSVVWTVRRSGEGKEQ